MRNVEQLGVVGEGIITEYAQRRVHPVDPCAMAHDCGSVPWTVAARRVGHGNLVPRLRLRVVDVRLAEEDGGVGCALGFV